MNPEGHEIEAVHPAAPTLEEIAAGGAPGATAGHLAACAACAAYVEKLREEAAAFRARTNATAFAEAIRAKSAGGGGGARVVALPSRRGARVAWALGPIVAAAAAVLLWMRAPAHVPGDVSAPGEGSSAAASDVGRFKGGISVAAIRERGGEQVRLMGPFEVRAGDRIRVEIAVDHDAPIEAGLLSTDGTWTPLLTPTMLSAGTHYSDLAARFDATPTDARLLVGEAPAVERARTNGNVDGIVAWRVRSAPPP